MKVILVDLGPTFPNPSEISNLVGGGLLEVFTEESEPEGVVGWKIATQLVKSIINQARAGTIADTPLVIDEFDALIKKLDGVQGEEGLNAFWSDDPKVGFRYRLVSILADNDISMAILIEIPQIEGGLCVIAHIQKIQDQQ